MCKLSLLCLFLSCNEWPPHFHHPSSTIWTYDRQAQIANRKEVRGDLAMQNHILCHQKDSFRILIRSNCKHYIFKDDDDQETSSHLCSYFYRTSRLIWMLDSSWLLFYYELYRIDLSPHWCHHPIFFVLFHQLIFSMLAFLNIYNILIQF